MFAFFPTLRSVISAIMLVTLLFFGYSARANSFSCGTLDEQLKYAFNSGFTWVGSGIADNMLTTLWFININNGRWIILAVDDDLTACRILEGFDFSQPIGGKA